MKSMFFSAVVFSLFAILCSLPNQATPEADVSSKPCVVISGRNSKVTEPKNQRITSRNVWFEVWKEHKGQAGDQQYDTFYDPLQIPLVDFDEFMVIAMFSGSRGNFAGLMADSVIERKDELVLRFQRKFFQTAGPNGGGQDGEPFGFFVLPKSKKKIVLQEKHYPQKNAKPIWRDFAILK